MSVLAMGIIHLIALTLLMMTSSKAVSASCPGQCECVGESVNCDDASLYHFPNDLPNIDQFATFSLRHNQLTSLNGIKAELKYHHVRKLNLSSNQFESLDFGRFESIFPRLEQLDLSHNRIATVIPGKSSWRLTTLSLTDNRLVGRLPDDAFTHLAKLVRLDLSDNSLEGFERDSVLPPQRNLKLIMRHNPAEFGCEFMLSFWEGEHAGDMHDTEGMCVRIARTTLCNINTQLVLLVGNSDELNDINLQTTCYRDDPFLQENESNATMAAYLSLTTSLPESITSELVSTEDAFVEDETSHSHSGASSRWLLAVLIIVLVLISLFVILVLWRRRYGYESTAQFLERLLRR